MGSWDSTPEAEYRLEMEAGGIRVKSRGISRESWTTRRVRHHWPWITVTVVVLLGAAGVGTMGLLAYQQAQSIEQQTQQIETEISNG
jgi:hypothetical protein